MEPSYEDEYLILSEKYRPKKLDNVIGQSHLMPFFKGFAKNKQIPHMLFAGNPGTGKTTVAKALARDMFGDDWKKCFYDMNASDERKLETIRTKVKDIARTIPLGSSYKIIFMDEADSLAPLAQPALRRIIEDYSEICRFILSCNYPNKIIPPIKDRLFEMRFRSLKTADMSVMLNKIVTEEQIDITKSAVSLLATLSNGSMRKALGILSAFKMADIKQINDDMIYDVVYWVTDEDIKGLLISTMKGDWIETDRKLNNLLYQKIYTHAEIFEALYRIIKESDKMPTKAKLEVMLLIGDVEARISMGSSQDIQLRCLLVNFIKIFEKYYERE